MDTDDFLDPEGAAGCGIARLGVVERPPVITRSGRAVKTGLAPNYLVEKDAITTRILSSVLIVSAKTSALGKKT